MQKSAYPSEMVQRGKWNRENVRGELFFGRKNQCMLTRGDMSNGRSHVNKHEGGNARGTLGPKGLGMRQAMMFQGEGTA